VFFRLASLRPHDQLALAPPQRLALSDPTRIVVVQIHRRHEALVHLDVDRAAIGAAQLSAPATIRRREPRAIAAAHRLLQKMQGDMGVEEVQAGRHAAELVDFCAEELRDRALEHGGAQQLEPLPLHASRTRKQCVKSAPESRRHLVPEALEVDFALSGVDLETGAPSIVEQLAKVPQHHLGVAVSEGAIVEVLYISIASSAGLAEETTKYEIDRCLIFLILRGCSAVLNDVSRLATLCLCCTNLRFQGPTIATSSIC